MNRFLPKPARCRSLGSRFGSLLLLLQKSPVVQMLFPEARVIGGAGICELGKWTVATVAGLGAFDSVAGATTIAQISPNAGSSTVDATKGKNLSFVFQLTNYPDTPGSWSVSGLPAGLVHADAKNNSIDSVSGTPTQTGTFSVKVTAHKKSSYSGDSFSRTFTMTVTEDTSINITGHPSSVSINSGQTATLNVTATGAPPLRYQWYRGTSGATTSPVGTNSPTFTTPALTATTKYWVKVSNAANTTGANSVTATVTVRQPAAITTHPAPVTISSGQSATLGVVASGTAPLTYQWYQGTSGTTTTPVGTNSPTFITPPLTASTNYWVKVTNAANPAGAFSQTAAVTVTPPPIIGLAQVPGTALVSGVSKVDFGRISLGAGEIRTFSVSNTDEVDPISNLALALAGPNAGEFILTGPSETTLAPAASTTFSIEFRPSAAGVRSATLQLTSGIAGDTPFDVALVGSSFLPFSDIAVQQPAGSNLTDGKSKKTFGTAKVGVKGRSLVFSIRNTGGLNLTGLSITKNGAHARDFIVSKPTRTTVAPGGAASFTIYFKPTAKGTRTAAVHIRSNDQDENPFDISLSGLAVP